MESFLCVSDVADIKNLPNTTMSGNIDNDLLTLLTMFDIIDFLCVSFSFPTNDSTRSSSLVDIVSY